MPSDPTMFVPPDQPQRDLIVAELNESMLVEAAAGTGKTTSIINRMTALLKGGHCEIDKLAAVTFTRKAASEIRLRFQAALESALQSAEGDELQRLQIARDNQQQCFIGTIHSFCARLLRERPVEAELEMDFREIDESEDRELRLQAWRQYVDQLLATDDPLVEQLEEVGLRLSRSVSKQRRVVDELEELGLELPQLGAAFMDMAGFPDVVDWPAPARELPDLEPIRVQLQAYLDHAASLNLIDVAPGTCKLIPRINRLGLASRHVDWNTPVGLMELLEHFESSTTKPTQKQWPGKKDQALAEEDCWKAFRADVALPALQAWREHRYAKVIQVLLPAFAVYNQLRSDLHVLNFQDLLLKARDLLHQPTVRRYFRHRITHLLVDEFQDTDPIQAELMLLLTAEDVHENDWKKCRPAAGSLFVVGDPKQSIYRFRRADMEIYFAVRKMLDESARLVQLSTNFRSSESMIGWINETFDPVFPTELTSHQAPRRSLEYGNAMPMAAGDPNERSLVADGDKAMFAARAEAKWIAARVQELMRTHKDLQPEHFLLLTRTKARLSVYAAALHEAGIPHEVTGGNELNKSPELRMLRDLVRCVARPDDPLALLAVLRGELFGVSDQTLYRWRQSGRIQLHAKVELQDEEGAKLGAALERVRQYDRWFAHSPLPMALERVVEDIGLLPRAVAHGAARAGALGKAMELLRTGAIHGAASDLLERLEHLTSTEERRDGAPLMAADVPPMRVMNLHQAKGLEAEVVFLADPSGKGGGPIRMHIARDGEHPQGHLAVYSGLQRSENKWHSQQRLLACPVGWDAFEAEERQFLDAENERLMYVAGTRAGAKIIGCPRATQDNPWHFFHGRFPEDADAKLLESITSAPAKPPQPLPAQPPAETIAKKWQRAAAKSYRMEALKDLSLQGAAPKPVGSDPDGAFWGSAVHTVLEVMLQNPNADAGQTATEALREQNLDPSRADELLATLDSVRQSSIWQRASDSSLRYCEVPLCTKLPPALASLAGSPGTTDEIPTLVRGVIDLVFQEKDGWVIADYKSDAIELIEVNAAAKHYAPQLQAYAAAWEHLTGERVVECGLLFTYHSRYVRVS